MTPPLRVWLPHLPLGEGMTAAVVQVNPTSPLPSQTSSHLHVRDAEQPPIARTPCVPPVIGEATQMRTAGDHSCSARHSCMMHDRRPHRQNRLVCDGLHAVAKDRASKPVGASSVPPARTARKVTTGPPALDTRTTLPRPECCPLSELPSCAHAVRLGLVPRNLPRLPGPASSGRGMHALRTHRNDQLPTPWSARASF